MNAKPTAYPILGHKHSNGDARNRTKGNIGEKPLTCHRQNEAENLGNKMKNIRRRQLTYHLTILFYHVK